MFNIIYLSLSKIQKFLNNCKALFFRPSHINAMYHIYHKLGYIDEDTLRKATNTRGYFKWFRLPKQIKSTIDSLNSIQERTRTPIEYPDHWLEYRKRKNAYEEYKYFDWTTESPEEWSDNTETSELETKTRAKYLKDKIEELKAFYNRPKPKHIHYPHNTQEDTNNLLRSYREKMVNQFAMVSFGEHYTEATNCDPLENPMYTWS